MTEPKIKFNVSDRVMVLESINGAGHDVGSVGVVVDSEIDTDYFDNEHPVYLVSVNGEEWWHGESSLASYVGQSVKGLLDALKEIQEFGSKNCGFGFSCSEIAKNALKDWA